MAASPTSLFIVIVIVIILLPAMAFYIVRIDIVVDDTDMWGRSVCGSATRNDDYADARSETRERARPSTRLLGHALPSWPTYMEATN
jgi:hypothetical protein